MNTINRSRRNFIKTTGALALGSTLPMSLVELAFADSSQNFTFAYISDAHIQQIKGTRFVRNWDRGLIRAVAEANLLTPKPDFVMFGGDLAQLGSAAELDHGAAAIQDALCDGRTRLLSGSWRVLGETVRAAILQF